MAAKDYQEVLPITLHWEGGWSNHPADPGGATMRGVTQQVYDGYRQRRGLPLRSVRNISEEELQTVYRKQYWDVVRGDDLPRGLDLAVFDFAVNSGPSRAVKFLQKILGVRVDGQLGEATLQAIRNWAATKGVESLAVKLTDNRLAWLKTLGTWSTFGKGWSNRIKSIRKNVIDLADDKPVVIPSTPAPPEASAKGVSEDQAVTKTSTGKGAVITGAGTTGTVITEMAEKLMPVGESIEIIKYVSAGILCIGVAWTLYGVIKTTKSSEILA